MAAIGFPPSHVSKVAVARILESRTTHHGVRTQSFRSVEKAVGFCLTAHSWLQLIDEVPSIANSVEREVVREEVERRDLVPGWWHRLVQRQCFEPVFNKLDLAGSVVGEIDGGRRGSDFLSVNNDECSGGDRIDGDSAMHTPRREKRSGHKQ